MVAVSDAADLLGGVVRNRGHAECVLFLHGPFVDKPQLVQVLGSLVHSFKNPLGLKKASFAVSCI
jgi:hypothetical protein